MLLGRDKENTVFGRYSYSRGSNPTTCSCVLETVFASSFASIRAASYGSMRHLQIAVVCGPDESLDVVPKKQNENDQHLHSTTALPGRNPPTPHPPPPPREVDGRVPRHPRRRFLGKNSSRARRTLRNGRDTHWTIVEGWKGTG